MNVVSKILAFVTALSLFFPEWFTRWRRSQPDPGIEQAAGRLEPAPGGRRWTGKLGTEARNGPDERDRLNRVVDHEVKGHFPPGAVRRAVLPRHGDEPGIEPGQTLLRMYVLAAAATDDQALGRGGVPTRRVWKSSAATFHAGFPRRA